MSAITGIFRRDGKKVDPSHIRKMNDILVHRGPDGSRTWYERSVAFGHQMLHSTPESLHETLPLEDKRSGLVITADARIDNRNKLSKELDIENKEDVSDGYFILKAYEKWGEMCPDKLLGDFSFAIWDKTSEKLFCARDHMGIKPFYYYSTDDFFIFSTEIKALLTYPEVLYRLNEYKVAFFLMDIEDNKSTFYENIYSCLPAHSISINHRNIKIKRYWRLDNELNINMDSDEEYAKKFYEIFKEAVNCRLRSSHPIGFELSGGLDSSSIVCVAKEILNYKTNPNIIQTFSIIYDGFPQLDETKYIQNILNTGEINANFTFGGNIKPFDQIETILWCQEEPFFTPNMVNLWKLYKKMHENDMRVILSGGGGDSVISFGDNYFRDLAVSINWKLLIKEINSYSKKTNVRFSNLFLTNVVYPLIPQNLKKLIRFNRSNNNIRPTNILNRNFANKIEAEKYLEDIYWKPLRKANTAKKHHHLILSTDNIYFLEMLDRTNSFFSLETRYPYLDKRLVEFCYGIPTEMKFKDGWYRYIQRIAMEGILPKKNQWIDKGPSISPIFDRNLLLWEEKRLKNILCFNNKIIEKYVNLERIQDICQNRLNQSEDINSLDIWRVAILFYWLRENKLN